jgi:hypothetical protein
VSCNTELKSLFIPLQAFLPLVFFSSFLHSLKFNSFFITMGKPNTAPPQSYRDDPSLEDAVSLHTTQGDDDILDVLEGGAPPAYTDSEGSVSAAANPDLDLPVNSYHVDSIKNVKGVDIVFDPRFDTDPVYAEHLLKNWSKIRPAQMIYIKGTHTQTVKNGNKEEKNTITDFDIKLRLTEYIVDMRSLMPGPITMVENNEKTYRGTVFKTRAQGAKGNTSDAMLEGGKPTLLEWCHLYCASHARMKK